MQIAGLEKNSFVDYPAKIAAVVFTPGCNFNCWYCHNYEIISQKQGVLEETDVLGFLKKRSGFLDGVVISGGEPTLQPDLMEFIQKIRRRTSLLIKLDTNGTKPDLLEELIAEKMVDYVAMDLKAPLTKYPEIVQCQVDGEAIRRSIALLLRGKVPYEFRTTLVPTLSEVDLEDMAREIAGAERYVIQQYRPVRRGKDYFAPKALTVEEVSAAAEMMKKYVKHVHVRGL